MTNSDGSGRQYGTGPGTCCGGMCLVRNCTCGPDLHVEQAELPVLGTDETGLPVIGTPVLMVGVPLTEPDDSGDTPHTDALARVEAVMGVVEGRAVPEWTPAELTRVAPVLFPESTALKIAQEQDEQMAAEARARQMVFPADVLVTFEDEPEDGYEDEQFTTLGGFSL